MHFYGRQELDDLTAPAFRPVHAPREDVVRRAPPKHGCWSQWEAVYERVVSGGADRSARRA